MDFAMSYSCGKDSTLALHKMVEAGNKPGCLLTMLNKGEGRSWFHGVDEKMLLAYEKSLGIPLFRMDAACEEYASAFENALAKAKSLGMEACAFGDIDLDQNRRWGEARCEHAGMEAIFPLWKKSRAEIIQELHDLGYKCIIKAISTDKFPNAFRRDVDKLCHLYLGKVLDNEFLRHIENMGADMCGENGEYHTIVVDGPFFHQPLSYRVGKILRMRGHDAIEIKFI